MRKIFLFVVGLLAMSLTAQADVHEVSTVQGLKDALLLDGDQTVKLTADIGTVYFKSSGDGKNWTGNKVLDLNGHTITAGESILYNSESTDVLTITGNGVWHSISSWYAFYFGADQNSATPRDNGHIIIENGDFSGSFSNAFLCGWESNAVFTINGGTFVNTSGGFAMIQPNNYGSTININGGYFKFKGSNALAWSRAKVTFNLNGGTFFQSSDNYTIASSYSPTYALGTGKVIYLGGQKLAIEDLTASSRHYRLMQIADSDDDFVTVEVSNTEGGKGILDIMRYDTNKPNTAKILKNTPMDIGVKANPNTGYRFVNYSNVSGTTLASTTDAETTFPIGTSDITFKANFETKPLHTISYNVGAGGSFTSAPTEAYEGVWMSGTLHVEEGYLPVSLSTEPVTTGFVLDKTSGWESDRNWYFNYNMPDANVTVNAVVLPERTVTIADAAHGTVTADATKTWEGAEVTLTVNADDNYRLQSLTAVDGSSNPVAISNNKFTMPASDVTVTAVFEAIPSYTITINDAVGGSVASTPAGSSRPDSLITLTITENAGYVLTSISVKKGEDDVLLNEVDALHRTFTMPEGNVTVSATFEASVMFAITKDVKGTGTGNVTISQSSANVGREIIITATPDDECYIVSISVTRDDNSEVVAVVDNKFTMPAAEVTVTVVIDEYPDVNVSNATELKAALLLETPARIHLTTDISGVSFKSSGEDKNWKGIKILDLAGHTLIANPYLLYNSEATDVLTITGNGVWQSSQEWFAFEFGASQGSATPRDNGHIIIENGDFSGSYTDAFLDGWESEAVITINGGTFVNTSGGFAIIQPNNYGSTININGGYFKFKGSYALARSRAKVTFNLNGGTFFQSSDYYTIASGYNPTYALGTGKVIYLGGQKLAIEDLTASSRYYRLMQIADSDDDFVTVEVSNTEGGKGILDIMRYDTNKPSTAKILKNTPMDIGVKAIANNESYEFANWSNVSGTTLADESAEITSFFVGDSDIAIKANFSTATGVDEIVNGQSSNRKFIKDGQLFIEREGKTFNAQGVEVR
ncbi:MAG: hypothetical protein K6F10_01250 [Paludibacteraceae bacterium]|nr:hypothetical protein [Paludibacteraceae bacterium]